MSVPPTVGWSPGPANVENQVKGLIEAAEANIARLTAQIRELDCLRAKERSVLATLRLMIIPIGKLPTEILVEIFQHTVQTPVLADEDSWENSIMISHSGSATSFHSDSSAAIEKVLCLSRVCSYWRKIVDATPALWAEGVVSVTAKQVVTPSYLDGLKSLLTRSTPYPISVAFASDRTTTRHLKSWARHVLPAMLPTAQRWRNLEINPPSFLHLNELSPGAFASLERLHIRNLSEQTGVTTAFQSCPRLRNFALDTHGDSRIHLILDHLPWWQLVEINIEDSSLSGCRAALLQCSNIVLARFLTSFEWDSKHAVQSPTVVLPCLKTLFLSFIGPNDYQGGFDAFLVPLSLPSLTRLDFISDCDTDEFWPTEEFSAFQDRSPNIQAIRIWFSSITSDGLIALLRHGPSLQTLNIRYGGRCVDNAFFDALYYDEADSAPLAPKLQEIHLEYVGDNFDADHFERAIRSRWWPDGERLLPDGSRPRVSRLTRAWITATDERVSDGLKERMEELVTQGLDLFFMN
ncbi:hypothetical protein B0H16DRAFT_1522516 [Mycena metata]|uniref:F-box domain-containing protein n=1 Tax=Mycena metata TaxID=1033252 RepID=A0AAD7JN29_9AGAR|nr:hypothetical protein B0H16DRAFT_1522516 [Mycena metata]